MEEQASELISEAIRLKREGDLPAARQGYARALALAPAEPVLYYGLAKVAYLRGDRKEAVVSYLRAAHLSYGQMKQALAQGGLEGQLLREELSAVPPELLSALREYGDDTPLVMLEENMARNLGHALLDLGSALPPEAADGLAAYRRALQGDADLDERTLQGLARLEEEHYLPAGREYLAANILWEMIDDLEVDKIY